MLVKQNPRFDYTGHGWEGINYKDNLGIKEIAQNVRKVLKQQYPECKFSVTIERYSGGQSMDIRLMVAPFDVFVEPNINLVPLHQRDRQPDSETLKYWKDEIERGHYQVNNYYIKDSYRLTEKAKEVMIFANKLAESFNFDDSDGMIDYFHTNFYLHLAIGKWDKPFVKQ